MKKVISLILVLTIAFSLMAGMGVSSNALTDVWESEPNNDPNQANIIKFGQIMNGITLGCNYSNDKDVFKINIDSNINFRIKFEHDISYTYDGWLLNLYQLNRSDGCYYNYIDNEKYYSYGGVSYDKVMSDEGISFSPIINARAGDSFVLRISSATGEQGDLKYMVSLEVFISKPSNLTCTARTTNAEKVAWNAVAGVTGYQVQCSDGGTKWAQNKVTTANSAVFGGLVAGGKYKFRVRAYKKIDGVNYFSPWSKTLNSPTLPSGTTLTKLSSAKKAFTAQWKKNAAVTGYQLQYGVKSNFSGAKTLTVKNAKTLKSTVKKLNAKKAYYVRIRTYKTISKVNYFSTWSKAYKVKTK